MEPREAASYRYPSGAAHPGVGAAAPRSQPPGGLVRAGGGRRADEIDTCAPIARSAYRSRGRCAPRRDHTPAAATNRPQPISRLGAARGFRRLLGFRRAPRAANLSKSPWEERHVRPDLDLLQRLLKLTLGAAQQSGRIAKAFDAWIAHELRRADSCADAVWPRSADRECSRRSSPGWSDPRRARGGAVRKRPRRTAAAFAGARPRRFEPR